MNIRWIICRPGHVQAPDRSAPAGRPGFGVGLIFYPSRSNIRIRRRKCATSVYSATSRKRPGRWTNSFAANLRPGARSCGRSVFNRIEIVQNTWTQRGTRP